MPRPDHGTVIAIDYGLKRMGLACGELDLGIAHPLTTVVNNNREKKLDFLIGLQKEWQPVLWVMGIPFTADNAQLSEFASSCLNFATLLADRTLLAVYLVNERYSSCDAEAYLKHQSIVLPQHKDKIDQISAQIILDAFFVDGSEQILQPSIQK